MNKLKAAAILSGVMLFGLMASLTVAPGLAGVGNGTVFAASTKTSQASAKQMAAVYAQIQAENAAKVVALVNVERKNAGLKPLIVHTNLSKMAKDKAIDMYKNNYFSHTSPNYGSPFDMMDAYNITYRYAGENIAKGQKTPSEVVTAWMNSPGHKANMLNSKYTLIGVGYFNGHWVQEFIGK
ncbi:CAP domain-containing protein [Paenibacillus bouchesdurhonensis]|uniref:CAP domain-containing protein n=1 Tax=Paenibacillus bouchesdurhonensis TaxID=1870990 RepID=UPI000DA5F7AF|nr:CAP domain-containing protein [Paenibacillus bouchesdurhonensis]